MKIKSVSALTCYVKDLQKTLKFYEAFGFDFKKIEEHHITGYVNWFSIDFVEANSETKEEFQKEANAKEKGAGIYINLSVDDVDACYRDCLKNGFTPSSKPRDWPWGNREFVIRDPDGYKLVIFKKK